MVFDKFTEGVGKTPLLVGNAVGFSENVYLKVEAYNPTGSVKDRAAYGILSSAILRKELGAGGKIVEATSGNMGISLAFFGGILGLSVRIYMPTGMTRERAELMRKYGAEVIFTPSEKGMAGAISEAMNFANESGAFYTRQFENKDGVNAHYFGTAVEIANSLGKIPDVFVAGVGTGATLVGVGKYFKERKECEVIAVEPEGSASLSGGIVGRHKIEGIGAGFIPPLYESSLVDRVITVSDSDAMRYFYRLYDFCGVGIGISSGAVLSAVEKIMSEKKYRNRVTVALLPDGRDRYLSVLSI